jgi:hypothetical protein
VSKRLIIAVDFDGTIAEHRYPFIGRAVPGAFEWLKRFQGAGAKLILWTMRADSDGDDGPVLSEAVEFCRKNGVEFWGVNANPEQAWSKSPKAYAHVYIDDAAFGCPLLPSKDAAERVVVDWSVVGPAVLALMPTRGTAS